MAEITTIPLEQLYEPHYNPRLHPQEQLFNLSESLREFGQRRTISVWPDGKGKYEILAGNGIRKAAELAKLKTLDCTIAPKEWDEVRRKAYALADNQSGYEDDMFKVAQILEEVRASGEIELAALGSSSEKVDALLEELANQALQDAKPGLGGDEFEIPEELEPKAKFGDVWRLGRHKLAVIDSTNAEQVKWFLDGVKVDMVFTDPPYDGEMGTPTYKDKKMQQSVLKRQSAITPLYSFEPQTLFPVLEKSVKGNISYYFFCNKSLVPTYLNYGINTKRIFDLLLWHKPNFLPTPGGHYYTDTEYLIKLRDKSGSFNNGLGDKVNYGTYWIIQSPRGAEKEGLDHPTVKPVQIPIDCILISTNVNDIVFDPFLGSGTTLIAAERTGRTCYGCEISEKYASVIIKRFEAETGQGAFRESSIELAGATNA